MNPEQVMISIQATPDTSSIRTAELHDVKHTVIPVVALVEGVLWPANAPSPELALAEEFGRFPDGWNGRPIMLDHPRANGLAISASSPDTLEDSSVGQMFNTVLDGKKLKSEIWLNSERVAALSEDDQAQVQRLVDGDELVEVSTGLFMMLEEKPGKFEGEDFDSIWRNIVPDHLAILPEGLTGACSVEDGCGAPRDNSATSTPWKPAMRAAMLSAQACDCDTDPATASADTEEGIFKRVLSLVGGILNFTGNSEHLSDVNVRDALNVALGSAEGADAFFFVLAVFQNSSDSGNSGTVVYELGFGGNLFERDFDIPTETGVVSLSEDKRAVRPVTQFVPVEIVASEDAGSSLQENAMNKAERVKALVDNEGTRFTLDDVVWLEALDETQLTKLEPAEDVTTVTGDVDTDASSDSSDDTGVGDDGTVADEDDTPRTVEDFISDAPPEIAEVLNEGMKLQAGRKKAIVDGLVANTRCKFSKKDLESKSLDELENLAVLANDVTFEGAGAHASGGIRDLAEGEEENFTAAPDIFPKKDAA